jgi:hypothetical protein
MSRYVLKQGTLHFHYGYDENNQEHFYEVYDSSRMWMNNGLIDSGGTRRTLLPPIVLAEKMKKFQAPVEHIQKVLWMRKI